MAKLIGKREIGKKTVVEITVEGGIYMSENGLIHHNCNHCIQAHLLPDGVTPKVWKLSEVKFSYLTKDEKGKAVSVAGQHPNCRCSLSFLAKNFGFKNGQVAYIGPEHDEYKKQKGEQ